MRVGIDVRGLVGQRTGLGWYTHAMVSHLLAQRPEQEFVLLSDRAFPEEDAWRGFARIDKAGGLWHSTAVRGVWDDWYYGRLLARAGCDVGFSPISAVPATRRIPAVAVIHDLAFLKFKEILPARYRRYWVRAVQRAVRSAAAIIAVSEATRRDLAFYLGADLDAIEVVHEGVDPFFLEPVTTEEAEQTLGRHGLDPGYLLFVGTDEPRKNLSLVLDAYAQLDVELRRQHPLAIAGGAGWLSKSWKAKERALESFVHRLGYVDRATLRVLYRHAACFLFPSLYEGFGLPVLEAMACGAPVIVSNTSSLPEIAGGAGEYVDPRSPAALARAVERVLSDAKRRAVMIQQGREQAAKFRWDFAARRVWRILLRAARG